MSPLHPVKGCLTGNETPVWTREGTPWTVGDGRCMEPVTWQGLIRTVSPHRIQVIYMSDELDSCEKTITERALNRRADTVGKKASHLRALPADLPSRMVRR